jgi:hypothetical protein
MSATMSGSSRGGVVAAWRYGGVGSAVLTVSCAIVLNARRMRMMEIGITARPMPCRNHRSPRGWAFDGIRENFGTTGNGPGSITGPVPGVSFSSFRA